MSTTDDKKAQLTDKKEQQPADQKKKDKKEEDLSEDDIRLKEQIELLVTRIQDVDSGVQKLALDTLKNEIRTATSSMTSVPKPLKFLRPHFETLKTHYATMADSDNKRYLADIISVVGMTSDSAAARDTLNFKLQGTKENVSVWGHEYLRHLASEISEEYADRVDNQKPVDDILVLVDQIVPYNVEHNAEAEACDLLMEVERVQNLIALATESNYQKICQYLIACSSYVPEEEDVEVLRVTMEIYRKLNKPTEAVRIAIRLGRKDIIKEILGSAEPLVQKQIAYMLARHNLYEVVADNDDYDLKEIAGNNKLSEHFLALVKELDVLEPKKPEEDIFKSHLSDIKVPLNTKGDSARNNLAVTFVNAFVNAGFGTDKLMLTNEEGNNWVFKNKDHGMLSAAASVGMLYLWDISTGLNQIDKYTLSNDDNIKAGAVLAGGLLCAGYRNDDIDPAVGFLPNYLEDKSNLVKTCACLGLGVAYAGSSREDIKGLLMTAFDNQTNNMESLGLIALALGLVFVGTGDAEISESFLSAFLEQTETALKSTYARYLCLGLGLLYLGKQEVAELTIEALKAISAPIGRYAMLTVETCAYMGSGNVLKIQKLLADCGEHPAVTPEEEAQKEKERDAGKEKDKEKEEKEKEEQNKKMAHQGVAVLGIAGIAMCEDVGSQMSMRSFDHLLQYGEPSVRRAVPLAIALINVSNADLGIMDTLSKLSHDHDPEVAMGAIFALGIVGAGTNNARIAQLLRQLASYYYKDPNMLFLVRIAQGYLHMGKGTIGVKPYHSERLLLNPVATSGLLAVLHSGLDMKNIILGKSHYMMYLLSLAMYPRALIAVNEEGEPINVSVRVGQAVDVIGQAGKPKTITGFQTHNTPVLLSHGERAELATDMYIPVASILEGVVIMKVNPDSKDAKKKKKEEAKAAAAAEKNGSK